MIKLDYILPQTLQIRLSEDILKTIDVDDILRVLRMTPSMVKGVAMADAYERDITIYPW